MSWNGSVFTRGGDLNDLREQRAEMLQARVIEAEELEARARAEIATRTTGTSAPSASTPRPPFPSFDVLPADQVVEVVHRGGFDVEEALAWERTHLQRQRVLDGLETKA